MCRRRAIHKQTVIAVIDNSTGALTQRDDRSHTREQKEMRTNDEGRVPTSKHKKNPTAVPHELKRQTKLGPAEAEYGTTQAAPTSDYYYY